jgi:hypothetical protein
MGPTGPVPYLPQGGEAAVVLTSAVSGVVVIPIIEPPSSVALYHSATARHSTGGYVACITAIATDSLTVRVSQVNATPASTTVNVQWSVMHVPVA